MHPQCRNLCSSTIRKQPSTSFFEGSKLRSTRVLLHTRWNWTMHRRWIKSGRTNVDWEGRRPLDLRVVHRSATCVVHGAISGVLYGRLAAQWHTTKEWVLFFSEIAFFFSFLKVEKGSSWLAAWWGRLTARQKRDSSSPLGWPLFVLIKLCWRAIHNLGTRARLEIEMEGGLLV